MKTWHVWSGDLDLAVDAANEIEAAKKAIKLGKPKNLGVLIAAEEVNVPDSERYMGTENILKEIGLWAS